MLGLHCEGRTTWIAEAHRDDGKPFVARADELLTAFLELESAVRGRDCRVSGEALHENHAIPDLTRQSVLYTNMLDSRYPTFQRIFGRDEEMGLDLR